MSEHTADSIGTTIQPLEILSSDALTNPLKPLADDLSSPSSDDTSVDIVTGKPVETPVPAATPSIERKELYQKLKKRISANTSLDRTLVSNQANKKLPFYNWFKYREGFSEPFINYILQKALDGTEPGILLDPFSGSGSALFAASMQGWKTEGIELLPVGVYATKARFIAEKVDAHVFRNTVTEVMNIHFAEYYNQDYALKHIAITDGAFPPEEERKLVGYLNYCHQHIENEDIRSLLIFAAFCILEDISYTRKDGQYLRWDVRSGRSEGKNTFNKGYIFPFKEAIKDKLRQMAIDLEGMSTQGSLFEEPSTPIAPAIPPKIYQGTCLELLPTTFGKDSVDVIITSPPYANRYDYTRTYALELVFLGTNDETVKHLRQEMLSCTVENKDKREKIESFYKHLGREIDFDIVDKAFHKQGALQELLTILDGYAEQKQLNNSGIATMVHNYFYEMCFVLYEFSRILRVGGTVIMVNDNVRYAGEEVPVDLILSDIAENFGLKAEHIWTVGKGKGNSSQQMGTHGRSELRKCVYIWKKEASMAKVRENLLIEAHQVTYRLRSTFFYRKIKEYNVLAFPSLVAHLFPSQDLYNWDERTSWGIGDDAFEYINSHPDLKMVQVFCHPRLLREYPSLLAYYRNIAALSQKSVGYLVSVDVKKYEADPDNKNTLTSQQAFTLSRLFNEHISLIIDSSLQSFNAEELNALLLTSTGAQIDGAWRNAIGEEAEKVVQSLIIKEAVKRNSLVSFIPRIGTLTEPYNPAKLEEQLGEIGKYRGVWLNNQTSILFSSEPDISLIGKHGNTAGVIEIKGGTDPAGALERYGAAKKSFAKTLSDSPTATTILIASCITPEAQERISTDKAISRFFNLTEIIKEKNKYNELVDLMFSLLDEAHDQ